ncbi:hypothetical protein STSP2_03170 [Anaerohalosphaera lusitana]|uniref:Uncharacterized protein n=1 Tax=Anaerohalosphaera lusitana TaxID=1936003 RepID=A0A1U9NQS4_9BACT|nr:hypothetical protein [Anaerohalosphaera lusitana]AQT69970.1 hypothetical protein STSP2_03170 [Anaerohalosphaera lusitana]
MSTIGTITFLRMTGPQLPSLSTVVVPFQRPGVAGAGFRKEAAKADDYVLETVQAVGSQVSANQAANAYAAYKGQLVTVVDDTGKTTNAVMVLDARVTRVARVATSIPAGTEYLVYGRWSLKPTA